MIYEKDFQEFVKLLRLLFDEPELHEVLDLLLFQMDQVSNPTQEFFKHLKKLAFRSLFDDIESTDDSDDEYSKRDSQFKEDVEMAIESIVAQSKIHQRAYNFNILMPVVPRLQSNPLTKISKYFIDKNTGKSSIEKFCESLPFHCTPIEVIYAVRRLRLHRNTKLLLRRHMPQKPDVSRRLLIKALSASSFKGTWTNTRIGFYKLKENVLNVSSGCDAAAKSVLNPDWKIIPSNDGYNIEKKNKLGYNLTGFRSFESRLIDTHSLLNMYIAAYRDLIFNENYCTMASNNVNYSVELMETSARLVEQLLLSHLKTNLEEITKEILPDSIMQKLADAINYQIIVSGTKYLGETLLQRFNSERQKKPPELPELPISPITYYVRFKSVDLPPHINSNNAQYLPIVMEMVPDIVQNPDTPVFARQTNLQSKFISWVRNPAEPLILNGRDSYFVIVFANFLNYLSALNHLPDKIRTSAPRLISFFRELVQIIMTRIGTFPDTLQYLVYENIAEFMDSFDNIQNVQFFGLIYYIWMFYNVLLGYNLNAASQHPDAVFTFQDGKFIGIQDGEPIHHDMGIPIIIGLKEFRYYYNKHNHPKKKEE